MISFSSRNRYVHFGLIITSLFLLSLYYFGINKIFMTVTSDVASIALMADDFLSGNYFLKGWGLPSDSYYTVGALYAVIFMLFCGFTTTVVYLCASVSAALAVLCSFMLIAQQNKANFTTYLIAAVLLITPPTEMLASYATPACHVATAAYLLIAIWLIGDLQWNKQKNSVFKVCVYSLLYFTLLILANLGDPFGYVMTAAMFAVFGYRFLFFKEKLSGVFAGNTILAVVSVNLLLKLIASVGGFTSHPLSSVFTFDINTIAHNATLFIESSLSLFGMFYLKFLGDEPFSKSYYALMFLRAPFFLAVLYAFILSIKDWWKGDDIVVQIGCMVFFADASAFIISAYSTDLTGSRFLIPMLFLGVALVGRQFVIRQKALQVLFLIFAIGCGSSFAYRMFSVPVPRPPVQELIAALDNNNLTIGYGNYWASSVVTLETNKRVTIRPMIFKSELSKIVPTGWNSSKKWYVDEMKDKKPNFFIVSSGDPVYSSLMQKKEIIKIVGEPSKIITVSNYYEILVWNKGIKLSNA